MTSDFGRTAIQISRRLWKVGLYLLIPGLGATSSFVAIPAVSGRFGAAGWSSVAIGISIGATAAAVADLGWGIVGPQSIAQDPSRAQSVYQQSQSTKMLTLILLCPVAVFASASLDAYAPVNSALVALGTLLTVLSPSWYFVGLGRPGTILWTDTVPRLTIAFASAFAVLFGAPLFVYGVGSLATPLLTYYVGSRSAGLPLLPRREFFSTAPSVIRKHAPLISGNIVSTIFTSAPAALLAISATTITIATYSAVDRPLRMGLNILSGIPARLQSWVGTPDRLLGRQRSAQSVAINAALGLVAMVGFIVLAPPVTAVLFSSSVTVSYGLAALGGAIAALICLSRGLGLALVSEGVAHSISLAVYAGAAVGLALLLVLPRYFSVTGALIAIAAAEAVMIVIQVHILSRARRNPLPSAVVAGDSV